MTREIAAGLIAIGIGFAVSIVSGYLGSRRPHQRGPAFALLRASVGFAILGAVRILIEVLPEGPLKFFVVLPMSALALWSFLSAYRQMARASKAPA
jgi:hypothetical protein